MKQKVQNAKLKLKNQRCLAQHSQITERAKIPKTLQQKSETGHVYPCQ